MIRVSAQGSPWGLMRRTPSRTTGISGDELTDAEQRVADQIAAGARRRTPARTPVPC